MTPVSPLDGQALPLEPESGERELEDHHESVPTPPAQDLRRGTAMAGVTRPSGRFSPGTFLSDVVLALNLADPDRVEAALQASRNPGETLEGVFLDSGVLDETELAQALSERYNVDLVDLFVLAPDPTAQALLPLSLARRYEAVPVRFLSDRKLLVALADPSDWHAAAQVTRVTGFEARVAVAPRSAILAVIDNLESDPDAARVTVARTPDGDGSDAAPAPLLAVAADVSPSGAETSALAGPAALPLAPGPLPVPITDAGTEFRSLAPTPATELVAGAAPSAQLEELRRWLIERWLADREARLEIERVQLQHERAELLGSRAA